MNELIIRTLKKEDLPSLVELYKQYNHETLPLSDESVVQKCWSKISSLRNIHYFIGEYENKIVTSCFLIVIPHFARAGKPYGLIENVITDSSYRGKGFATSLLKHALESAWKNECFQVMLLTGNKKKEATKLYEKVGFQQGIKTGFIAYPK